jgi:translation initiation factor 2 beta subunit (eIF-2beta)/eIF-5
MGDKDSEYECTWCGKFFEDYWQAVREHVFPMFTTCNKCDEMNIPITEFGAAELCDKCDS